jgi:hypothetical protein
MATLAADCPLDADALHARAIADTGLYDFGPDDYRERLDVYLATLHEIDGMHGSGIVCGRCPAQGVRLARPQPLPPAR